MPPWYAWIAGRPSARSNAGASPPLPRVGGRTGPRLRRGSRGVSALRQKMETYRANGAQLGWLLLPEQRAVEIWRAGATSSERQGGAATLEGGELFAGLTLDLAPIWEV
ncbi:Uma2 family endonuclease [Cyanobium sp. ATX-6F1]|uniref:Uma2 family endonuclease n=1 Tax=Cyanobium sp. ATX-6F1 TaxID=3137388 RepID=UPI0039BE0377